jgi:hypothetical protein
VKIEAITVCVGYADFLQEIAPCNLPFLDRWVVVTEPGDQQTRTVCRRFGLTTVLTQETRTHGDGPFNKARAINRGLQHLMGDGWILHLDGDIALPVDFKRCLADAHLRQGALYGCDRFNVDGWTAWQACKARGLLSRRDGWLVDKHHPHAWVKGPVAIDGHGYLPVGFFQLWWGAETLNRTYPGKVYPEGHGNAARTDVQFALHWDRRDRIFLPELMVWHLESEPSWQGRNWNGRKSAPFGPASTAKASATSYMS